MYFFGGDLLSPSIFKAKQGRARQGKAGQDRRVGVKRKAESCCLSMGAVAQQESRWDHWFTKGDANGSID
jgi:hypothetical protein